MFATPGSKDNPGSAPSASGGTAAVVPAGPRPWLTFLIRWGALGAMLITIAAFSLAEPDTFPTSQNLSNILTLSAIPLLVAIGLTVVLVMGDFDLSIGATMSFASALAAVFMSTHGMPWALAGLLAVGVGVLVGLANGVLVAYVGTSSLITTLAMGSVLTGLQYYVTDQETIYSGLSPAFVSFGQGSAFLVSNIVWVALASVVVVGVVLQKTQFGRYMYAIGSNVDAARLAGVRTELLRTLGFAVTGAFAALAGVVLAAQAASSYPDAGNPYLLPSYAAAFLGGAVLSRGSFSATGTAVGAVFLIVVQVGLTMLSLSTWIVNLFQGLVLLIAIVLTKLERNS